ncbi:hypothetical protein Pth03_30770 [Planotetraspora thailandica]|uniref:HTH araC/xylS-type domain-containing protein n=1 Tax=Planotetraspora thailandica TaxID=487172 RepID=A0A8J3UZF3_9ACTN|nr:AraC family transcriptional regulator [Planotetraspora thailandica]GII54688.1 hypothetical protein Pth03_30770 [Planotetraspora thailandica]
MEHTSSQQGTPTAVADFGDSVNPCRTAFEELQVTVLDAEVKGRPAQRYGEIGPIWFGDAVNGVDLRVEGSVERPGYQFGLPISGHLESRLRGVDVIGTPGKAILCPPEGEASFTRWAGDCRLLCVGFVSDALERTLEGMLGRQVTSHIALAPRFDTTTARAAGWVRMLRTLTHEVGSPDTVFRDPLVARPLIESVLRGFLLTADHPYRETLDTPAEACRPVAVRTAIEIMEAEPEAPLTVSALAARCRVGVRTLQEGFQRHVGMSPMAYLRAVRLRRAHDDLRAADPSVQTVASIARRWGFTHLGRFAAAHEAEYGVSPVQVLRSPR